MNQSKEMTKLAIAALEDKKANDVRVIDIAGVSVIADYFVKRRKGYKTIENHKQIKHVDEMLKFMRIFVEDERF